MFSFVKSVFNFFSHKVQSLSRSGRWRYVRKNYLACQPQCQVCGCTKNLNVHHIVPVHVAPALELEPSNLITLCECRAHNCHFIFGHLYDWKSWNKNVVEDARVWADKVKNRKNP